MKSKLLLSALSLFGLNSFAQVVPNIDWVQYYSERAQISNVPSAIDANSNVYITGYTYPTPSNADLTTIKYDATGSIVWVKHYNNGGYDDANAITLDASSNVYVAGESDGTGTGRDLVVVKYDVNGNQLWASRFNGAANLSDVANAIVVDGPGNVYVTGRTTVTGGTTNYVTIKYDASGVQQWVSYYNGTGNNNDESVAIDLSSSGRLYVTGTSRNASGNNDIVTIRLNPNNGNQMWVKSINGSANSNDRAYALLADGNDVVVVGSQKNTVTNDDYITLKYNGNNGSANWQKTYDYANSFNEGTSIAKDASNNYVVTGRSLNGLYYEYHTLMYSNAGVQQWVNTNKTNIQYPSVTPKVAVDPIANHFYICGEKKTTTNDIVVYQITPSGNKSWEETFNGSQNAQDAAVDLVVNNMGIVYVAGASLNSNAKFDYTTIRISQTPVYNPIDYNNVPEPFSFASLYYPNTGEVRDTSGNEVTDVLFYTKHTFPKEYIFGNKIAFCFSKQDTNSVNPVDTMVRVDMVINKAREDHKVYPFEYQENAVINYLTPSMGANGKTDVKGASRLMIPNVYPNIDLHYYSNENGLKYYFVVKPSGDPRQISLTFNGAGGTGIISGNDLLVKTILGNFTFKNPNIYNVTMALTTPTVTGATGWVNTGANTYGIDVGTYNTSLPLVIEIDKGKALPASPSTIDNITWSTYYGDIQNDFINQMKSDATKNLYVIGVTSSSALPQNPGITSSNIFQFNYKGTQDGFVAKFSPIGQLLWETYVGGSGQENLNGFDIANSGTGDLYCVGGTKSTNLLYTGKTGATLVNQSAHAGGTYDGFIFQLGQNGKTNNWLTYYGGGDSDQLYDCKFDKYGNLIIIGNSASSSLNVTGVSPIYTSPYLGTSGSGILNGYIMKLNNSTFNIDWATYISSTSNGCSLIALDLNSQGEIFVGGSSSGLGYPVVSGGSPDTYNYTNNGLSDGVITRFDNTGQIMWSSYFGGLGTDNIQTIKIDGRDLYFGGYVNDFNTFTTRTSTKFFNNTIKATYPSFPSNLSAEGGFFVNYGYINNMIHSTLIGGNGQEQVTDITVDAVHNVYIIGRTNSTNLDLPPAGNPAGMYSANNTYGYDFFIFTMQPNNTNPVWTTQIGGNDNEFYGGAAHIDANNNLHLVGSPKSNATFPWDNGGGSPVWFQNYIAGSTSLNNPDGSVTRLKLSPLNFVGIEEHSYKNDGFLLFPNPAQNNITVQLKDFKEKTTFTIYNNLGQIVSGGNILSNVTNINLSDLSSGIYLIEIANKESRLTTKFIKQ